MSEKGSSILLCGGSPAPGNREPDFFSRCSWKKFLTRNGFPSLSKRHGGD